MKNIEVSVIIPTYKRAEKLGRAVNSVLNQTYKNLQVIVVDDNSERDEYRVATELLMNNYINDSRVVYLKHKVNRNGSAARNTGIRYSNAEFIAFLDDDDFFAPKKIEKQLHLIKNSPDQYAGVCCCRNAMYREYIYHKNDIVFNENGNYLVSLLNGQNVLAAGSTLLVKREVFYQIGLFDEEFKRHQDYEFLIRFFREYKLLILNENLANICVDGLRNYPNAVNFHKTKSNLFAKFENDIMNLSSCNKRSVFINQWSEVFLYYFIEFQFKEAKIIYTEHIKSYKSRFDILFIVKCIYLLFEKKVPFLLPLKYMISSLRYKIISR